MLRNTGSKQRRLVPSAVKFSLPLPTQITPLRPVPELEKWRPSPVAYLLATREKGDVCTQTSCLPVTFDYSGDCKKHNKILSTNTFPLYFLGYSPDDGVSPAALGLCPVISDTANTSKNCERYKTTTFSFIAISALLLIILIVVLIVYCRRRKLSKENAEKQPLVTAKSVSPEIT